MWPKITWSASISSRSTTTCIASTPARPISAIEKSRLKRPRPGPLEAAQRRRDHRRAEQPPADRPRPAGGAADRLPDPHRPRAALLVAAEPATALGEAEDQVVDGGVDLLVVVRGLAPAGRRAGQPVDGRDREPLDRRQRHVAVEVVAVGRVDVVADPDPRVADLEPGVAEPVGDRARPPDAARRRSRRARRAAPRRGRARATGRAGDGRGCRARGRPRCRRTPRRSRRRSRGRRPAIRRAARRGARPCRRAGRAGRRPRRRSPRAGARAAAGRRSTSLPELAPRWRSEIRTVVGIAGNPRNSDRPAGATGSPRRAIARGAE